MSLTELNTLDEATFLAGRILQEEMSSALSNETGLLSEDDKRAVEDIMFTILSYRFHQIRTEDQLERLWNTFRQNTVKVDVVMNAAIRFGLLFDSTMNDIARRAANALGMQSVMLNCDEDLVEHTVAQEQAFQHFKDNRWYLLIFLAANAYRSSNYPDVSSLRTRS